MSDEYEGRPPYAAPLSAPAVHPAEALGPKVSDVLRRTRPWVRFLAIVGFVSGGFLLLGSIGAMVSGVVAQDAELAAIVVIYPLLSLLYIVPSIYLLKYANQIGEFLAERQLEQLVSALDAQRAFWKFLGVMTAVGFAVAVFGAFVALLVGLALGSAAGF